MNKHIELAKKLKALADRGVGGEKINAQVHLDKVLKKHNLKLSDLENENRIKTDFKYTDAIHKRFVIQIIQSVIGEREVREYCDKRYRKVFCYISIEEYLEIFEKLEFYWPHFQNELNIFTCAYIQTNDLYIKDSIPEEEEMLTEKEKENLIRMWQMTQSINQGAFSKPLLISDLNKSKL